MAKRQTIITALDVGSSKIRTMVASTGEKEDTLNILGVGIAPSDGLRKGAVIGVDELIASLSMSLEDAERMAGEPINYVFLGIGGPHISAHENKGVIAIAHNENEITEAALDRVLEAAKNVNLPNNSRILRVIPKTFNVDDQKGIKYPVSMIGVRLEAETLLVTGQLPIIKNIEKCVFQAGVDIHDIIPTGFAASQAVLNKRQKELGVVSIDIGSGGTSIVVYEEGSILNFKVIPIGGENVTNDIAIGLRASIDTAEKIKIEFGTCNPSDVSQRETIDLSRLSPLDTQIVSKQQLSEIIQARYHEIFCLVKDELRKIGKDGMLPAGAVLTGAAAKIPGLLDLARETLNLPVQIGYPQQVDSVIDNLDDPQFATAVGLLMCGSQYEQAYHGFSQFKALNVGKMWGTVKNWLHHLLP
ncbi:cell division protein FtsA [Candidatus Peregrinibacteria bacterium RIFOXYB2_FULL_32_7]|nr:MAG: cell division protein FtsA [Candidatus Peregrinibacteria bacterium RIFOXYB2_FULL_32_7]